MWRRDSGNEVTYSFAFGRELLGKSLIFEDFVGESDRGGVLAEDGLRLLRRSLVMTRSLCFGLRLRYDIAHMQTTILATRKFRSMAKDSILCR